MTYQSVIAAQSPVSYWRLGEPSGSTANDEQNAHDGTIGAGADLGEPGAISGDSDTSIFFNGATDVIATTGWSLSSANWTVSGLVQNVDPAPTTFHTGAIGLCPGTGAQTQRALCCTRRNATGNFLCYWDNTNSWQESSLSLTLDTWYYVAWSKVGTTLKIYAGSDGGNDFAEVGSFTLTEPADTYTDLFIGASQSTGSDAMKGWLDEMAVWDRGITAQEALAQYNAWQNIAEPVTRVAVATTAPASAAAFTPNLPTHAAGDRLILTVAGKYETTTVPTVNNSWTLLGSGTGGTGSAANDTGQTFWAVYAIDATSSAQAAPTVTPGGTAPNSWEAICASFRPATGKSWRDTITTSSPWVASGSDTNTASPLTAAATLTNQPTDGDSIACFGVIPTDLGTAIGSSSATGTGLSGGALTFDTYVENGLGQDTASVHGAWTGVVGTASGAITPSFVVTGASNHSGSVVVVALRQTSAIPATVTPSTVSRTAAVGTAVPAAPVTLAPSVISRTAAVGTAVPVAPVTLAPAAVSRTAAVGSPTVSISTTVTPATVSRTVAVGSPTVNVPFGPTPATVSGLVVMDAPTTVVDTKAFPAGLVIPVLTGSGDEYWEIYFEPYQIGIGFEVAPAAIDTTVSLDAVTVAAGSDTVEPDTVDGTTTITGHVVGAGHGVAAVNVAGTVAIDSPQVSYGATVAPATVPVVASLPAAEASEGGGATVAPSVVSGSVTVSGTAGAGAGVEPAGISRTITVDPPALSISHTHAATVIAATAALTATVSVDAGTVTPAAVARAAGIGTPIVTISTTHSAPTVAVAAAVANPFVSLVDLNVTIGAAAIVGSRWSGAVTSG